MLERPPTQEIGAPANVGVVPWGSMWLGDDLERVPELQWPISIMTYTSMLNDSQLGGLYLGTTLPIRRYDWKIDPNGCEMAMVEKLAGDMNLPILGKKSSKKRRSKGKFNHDDHLRHALKALQYGHYFMEIVAQFDAELIAHLRKLAPRPPSTIAEVSVERDGELKFIKQNVSVQPGMGAPPIPAQNLIMYVWDQEGANWFGRSVFRDCYRNWLIKDRLLRVDAVKHERNGVGVPVAKGAPGMGRQDLIALGQLAQTYKAGESAGGALPYGADLTLEGVRGALPDTIRSIEFHNHEMARSFLMMFMQLGESSGGNRALGEAFIDFFEMNQDAVAKWYAGKTTEGVIEDWWSWNVDPESDTTPQLVYERPDDSSTAFADLAGLITSGVIQVDDELEEAVREAMSLPPKGTPRQPAATLPPADPSGQGSGQGDQTSPGGVAAAASAERQGRSGRVTAATSPALPLPARPLRREPNEFELTAQVDFGQMDVHWSNQLDELFLRWANEVTPLQIDSLQSDIARTADLTKLAAIEAPAVGKDVLEAAMRKMYDEGVRQAIEEARAQGHEIAPPSPDDYADFSARAAAIDEVNARTLANMASTRAMRLSGGGLNRAEVAAGTADYLAGLKFAMLKDRLGGALSAAMNTGRRAVMAEGPAARYYSSEILDVNTCAACAGIDGTQYGSLAETENDYPGGGFVDCAGGDRCRGTVVAVYGEANA